MRLAFSFVLAMVLTGLLPAPRQAQHAVEPLSLPAQTPCPMYQHPPASEASKRLRAGDYPRAESLFRASLLREAHDEAAFARDSAGLVDTLTTEGRTREAVDQASSALAQFPTDGVLLDAYGRIRLTRGEMPSAGEAFASARKHAPCDPRIAYDFARYLHLAADYAREREELLRATALEPGNAAIAYELRRLTRTRQEQVQDLNERAAASPADNEIKAAVALEQFHDRGDCREAMPGSDQVIPLSAVGPKVEGIYAAAIDARLGKRTIRLELDTGASGITISRAVAGLAGVQTEALIGVGGLGSQGGGSVALGHVPDLQIGLLKLQNCAVQVAEGTLVSDVDGTIGADVFAAFLITLDVQARQLRLSSLPALPSNGKAFPDPELANHPPLADHFRPRGDGRLDIRLPFRS
jgi:thioredoxin-like negative regulator of GroEL